MPDKDCIITITIYSVFKNWERNSKYNVDISADLSSRNHYDAERSICIFMPAKVSFISSEATSNALLQIKMSYDI